MRRYISNFKPLFKQCGINYDKSSTVKIYDQDGKQFIFQSNIINIDLEVDNMLAFHGRGLWLQTEFDDRIPQKMVLSSDGQLCEVGLERAPHVVYVASTEDVEKYGNYLHHLYDGLWNNMEICDQVPDFDNLMSRNFDTVIYFILKL